MQTSSKSEYNVRFGYHLDRSLSPFLDTAFFRTVLGAQYVANRPGATGNNGLVGMTINTDIADSTVGIFPDVLMKSSSAPQSQLYDLYRFRLYPDSMNADRKNFTGFQYSYNGSGHRVIKACGRFSTGSSIRRLLKGALDL